MARPITGMHVLITGASSGIGAALAIELARHGARLALVARRREQLDAVAAACGNGHVVLVADVGRPAEAEGCIIEAHRQLGCRLDTVVLNAGYGFVRAAHETSHGDWESILATNLLGTAAGLRAAVPLLREQPLRDGWRGQVMVVSSGLARRAAPDMAAYSATKAAQLSLCEAARVELADQRIAVTSVHPVRTTTAFHDVCEQASGRPLKPLGKVPTQDAATVARCMVGAIARPRPEVWPHRGSRWLLGLAALWPSWADGIMAQHRR